MIDLYAWPTPNAHKVSIMLEECRLAYNVISVDINKGDQFKPDFLALNPNNRMPVIVDHDGPNGEPLTVFESGAILIYLAEKTGRFLAADGPGRYAVLQWLMFQMGGLGPMAGQAHHFRQRMGGVDVPYGVERYTNEVGRLYEVMNSRLGEAAYLGGADYSIADMACWPWARPSRRQGHDKANFPNLKRWFDVVSARPAVQEGMKLLEVHRGNPVLTDEARDTLFGKGQFSRK